MIRTTNMLYLPLGTKKLIIGNNESRKLNIKTNTAPNNVEEFQRRLKSFECGLWTCTTVSPLLCATYGWKLINKDILSCVTCKAMICTILPLPNQIEAYNVFSGKLKQRLKTGHKDWCEWPNNPTPSEYLHPPFHMTVHYANNLVRKASNLLALGNRIPYVNCEEILKKLGLEVKEVSRFFNIQPELNENHLNAAALILCGWEYESKEKLRCSLCFRSIGVWNFLQLSEGRHYEELEKKCSEREEKRKVIEEKKKHRERRLLIKEEKLKAKLLEEKKVALAEMEAKEKALKVKLTLEKMSKLENSDLSNPSDDFEEEEEEEMGEEEENLLLNEDGTNELIMEEEENIISEPGFTVDTSPENNALSDADSSHSSEHLPEAEETVVSKPHDAILDTESERNL
ncbi:Nuclear-interacting partner of ALK, partial [Armadillidium nasatum]